MAETMKFRRYIFLIILRNVNVKISKYILIDWSTPYPSTLVPQYSSIPESQQRFLQRNTLLWERTRKIKNLITEIVDFLERFENNIWTTRIFLQANTLVWPRTHEDRRTAASPSMVGFKQNTWSPYYDNLVVKNNKKPNLNNPVKVNSFALNLAHLRT